MLKAWVQNQSLGDIEIEERYRVWVANLRTDRYVTVGSPNFGIVVLTPPHLLRTRLYVYVKNNHVMLVLGDNSAA